LIADALRIHRAKRAILSDLNDEDRILLEVMAHQLLVVQGGDHAGAKEQAKGQDLDTPAPAPRTESGTGQDTRAESSIDGDPHRTQGTKTQSGRRQTQ